MGVVVGGGRRWFADGLGVACVLGSWRPRVCVCTWEGGEALAETVKATIRIWGLAVLSLRCPFLMGWCAQTWPSGSRPGSKPGGWRLASGAGGPGLGQVTRGVSVDGGRVGRCGESQARAIQR